MRSSRFRKRVLQPLDFRNPTNIILYFVIDFPFAERTCQSQNKHTINCFHLYNGVLSFVWFSVLIFTIHSCFIGIRNMPVNCTFYMYIVIRTYYLHVQQRKNFVLLFGISVGSHRTFVTFHLKQ